MGDTPPLTPNKKKPNPVESDGIRLDQSATDRLVDRVSEGAAAYLRIFGVGVKPPIVDVEIEDSFTETSDKKIIWTDVDSTRIVKGKIRFRLEPKKEVKDE